MKILVCGGRDYKNKRKVYDVLHELCVKYSKNYNPDDNWLPSDIKIIAGGAKGADSLAEDFAVEHFTEFKEYPAKWHKHGIAAGHIRNQQMLEEERPDLVVAFPGGKGTADMVRRSKKAGFKVMEVKDD
jgi:hypothetical protein